jgi:hypothetical protein
MALTDAGLRAGLLGSAVLCCVVVEGSSWRGGSMRCLSWEWMDGWMG